MKQRWGAVFLGMLFLVAGHVQGSAISIDDAVQTALKNNRELQAARFAVQKAQARLIQAGRWPNPEVSVSGASDFALTAEGEYAFSVGLYQNFPLTSRLALSRELGRLDVVRALREIRNEERLLIRRVHQVYLDNVAARERATAWGRIENELTHTLTLARQRVASGQGSLSETAIALAAQKKAWSEHLTATTEAASTLILLKTLLGLASEQALIPSDSLAQIVLHLQSLAGARPSVLHRPDAELLLLEADRASLEIRLARTEAWEGLRIGIETTSERSNDAPGGLGTSQMAGLTVSLPLPVWDRKIGRRAEKVADRDEATARLAAIRLEMQNSLVAQLQTITLLQRQKSAFATEALNPLLEAEKALLAGFEEGRIDLRDLLALRAQVSEFRLQNTALLVRLAEAYADLISISGRHPAVSRKYLEPTKSTL